MYFDVMKFKTITIFIHGGHLSQKKSMIFRELSFFSSRGGGPGGNGGDQVNIID